MPPKKGSHAHRWGDTAVANAVFGATGERRTFVVQECRLCPNGLRVARVTSEAIPPPDLPR